MDPGTNTSSMDLCDFVKLYSLPQCVCVSEGDFLSRAVQISTGDVLLLRSCDSGQVTLSYRNYNNHSWAEVNISLDNPQKFKVLLPKDTITGDRAVSMIMYPTVADLILDCPTYFEATTSYDDPYLPGVSVKAGDHFCFVGMVKNSKDGVNRLKVRDTLGNILLLSPDCRGNFCPLEDENEYTIKELIDLAPVQRRLKMVNKEQVGDYTCSKTGTECEISQNFCNRLQPYGSLSLSSSAVDLNRVDLKSLPASSGIVHLLKPESTLTLSPYNDPETSWTVPVSANLKVRVFSPDDYEVPVPRSQQSKPRIPLPLQDDVPKFQAPSAQLTHISHVDIRNFVDIYSSSFPVKAKIVDTSSASPFFQNLLQNIKEVNIYRIEETKRLYVKDTKSDVIYSLSHDMKISFVEYPVKFKMISELQHLPVGSEVTVLEDVSADFPKPFSLRFGDVIRIISNTLYFVKTKLISQDCQVIKCERIDPEGGQNLRLKLPLDLEVSMVVKTDPNTRRMIKLQELLSGAVPIPTQNVASVPDDSESLALKELPVDLQILRPMKEVCVVVSSSAASSVSPTVTSSNVTLNHPHVAANLPTIIGLPLTSGIVLEFKDKLDLFEIDMELSQADYIRLPIEKITSAQFKERESLLKVNPDYEDVDIGSCNTLNFGSSSTLDDCGSGRTSVSRTSSLGLLERRQKSTKMDKVRRLSKALNPKHWRHTKSEPEPLPHPSGMGHMTSTLILKAGASNEYLLDEVDASSVKSESFNSGSTASDFSTENVEGDENLYEDVEIGPITSSTKASTVSTSSTFALSGLERNSLPLLQVSPKPQARRSNTQPSMGLPRSVLAAPVVANRIDFMPGSKTKSDSETHANEVTKPYARAKHWATNIGNNISGRLNMKSREDTLRSNKTKPATSGKESEVTHTDAEVDTTYQHPKPPDSRPPLPPTKAKNKFKDLESSKDERIASVLHSIQKDGKSCTAGNDDIGHQNASAEKKQTNQRSILNSGNLDSSVSSKNLGSEPPIPKPRGHKKLAPSEKTVPCTSSPQPSSRKKQPRSGQHAECVETLMVDSYSSAANIDSSQHTTVKDNFRPIPPPKPKFAAHTTV